MRTLLVALFTALALMGQPGNQPMEAPLHGAPLRVVIAGLVHGHVAGFLGEALGRTDIRIEGVCEPDQQVAARYQKRFGLDPKLLFTDLETMLKQTRPQAVLVYTNTFDHRKVVETCARHGLPVMMEKPLAVSAEDAHAMAAVAERYQVQVLVNYETTWYRSNQAAYELAQKASLGEIRKMVVHDGHWGPKELGVQPEFLAWLTDPKLNGGGALYDFGCYGADLVTWLMDGQRPETVMAVTQQIKPEVYPNVDDEATIILTYPKAQAILQPSWNWPFDRKDLEVYGKTGYAITVGTDDLRLRLPKSQETLTHAKPLAAPFDDSINYLRAVVAGDLQPTGPSSLATNVIVAEILDAARRSAATGKVIRLSGTR